MGERIVQRFHPLIATLQRAIDAQLAQAEAAGQPRLAAEAQCLADLQTAFID